MIKTFLLPHLSNFPNVIWIIASIHVGDFGKKKCSKWNISLSFCVCLVFLPCLIKPCKVAANVLPKSNGSIPMSTELFIDNVAVTSGACIQLRYGWKEGQLKGLGSGIESVSILTFSVQETRDESTDKNNENWDEDSVDHGFLLLVAIIVALFIIFSEIERFR